ncbi:siderophore-interacting protein [Streptomyces sp. NPDC088768]|uniref:siderophore-interacting protein n=1 Tax=Streptomyces sp. NPDC088768 TaxID=3365894 RepID=UPI0038022F84
MAKNPRLMPKNPALYRGEVLRSARLTPSMQRVTVTGPQFADFPYLGHDHWFRLFVRLAHQPRFELPELSGQRWWEPYFAIPDEVRPHCANYTVAGFRPETGELDIDFVVHCGTGGEPEGAAAIWACAVRPGDPVALYDQGAIFDRPEDASEVHLVADESGLPAVAGILRSLPAHTTGRALVEVPLATDRRDLEAPAGMEIVWVVRDDVHAVPGEAVLAELRRRTAFAATGYAYVVGESRLATEGRRHLVASGLPKDRITFSGYWKHERGKVPAAV